MTKLDKNFRLSKSAKTMIALMPGSAESKHELKRCLIQAELASATARRQPDKASGRDRK